MRVRETKKMSEAKEEVDSFEKRCHDSYNVRGSKQTEVGGKRKEITDMG